MGSRGRSIALSVVSCAYNEEKNIANFLSACLSSTGESFDLIEIIVVASGCTDRTVEIVQEFAAKDGRIRLLTQPVRAGKASALAAGLKLARGDAILMENADSVPTAGALECVTRPLLDPSVTLVCGRLNPANTETTFVVQLSRAFWNLHHYVSMRVPKAAGSHAIRRSLVEIPADIQDDDAFIEGIAVASGGKAVYADEAVFLHRVPSTPSEFLRYRWRIGRQQLGLRRTTGIVVSGWRPQVLASALIQFTREQKHAMLYLTTLMAVEALVRTGAYFVTFVKRSPLVQWAPIQSTKESIER